jgi:hypothetical protein
MSVASQWTCFLWSPPRGYIRMSDSSSSSSVDSRRPVSQNKVSPGSHGKRDFAEVVFIVIYCDYKWQYKKWSINPIINQITVLQFNPTRANNIWLLFNGYPTVCSDSPPASAEVKKMWIYASTPPYALKAFVFVCFDCQKWFQRSMKWTWKKVSYAKPRTHKGFKSVYTPG